jgi:hypothetical protein
MDVNMNYELSIDDFSASVELSHFNGNLLARATLTLCDVVEIKGWRISKSNYVDNQFGESIWIQPPSYLLNKKYSDLVFINDDELFYEVKQMIYDEFKRQQKLRSIDESKLVSNQQHEKGDDWLP